MTTRERRILAVTAALAVGVPLGAAAWVRARTDGLAAHLTNAGGVPARIGSVDADLTGAIRLTDVALGSLVAVDAVEASVAMGSLLGGDLRADEIRVEGPRVAIEVDAEGDSDLARLARRLLGRSRNMARSTPGPRRLRRIVVDQGSLVARIAGLGELSADGVELVPQPGGVRVITDRVRVRGAMQGASVDVGFTRSAADLALPSMRFGRVLAVGGAATLRARDSTITARDVAAGRLAPGGALELRASIEDGGTRRPFGVDVSPSDFAVTVHGDGIPLHSFAALAPRALVLSQARASGSLTVRRRPSGVELSVDADVAGLVVDHPAFASAPVALTGGVRGDLLVTRDAIAVTRAGLDAGDAHLTASGWLRRGSPVSGQLDVALAPAPCADLLGSLPVELRGPLDGMGLTGTLGGRLRVAIDLAAPPGDGVTITQAMTGACTVTADPPAADVHTLVTDGEQQLADGRRVRIAKDDAEYVHLRRVPSYVTGAFVSAEDGRFWEHDGFDLEQIARSLEINLREGKLSRGGSTISQQLIKNAFLSQRRTFDRKLQEAVLTWRLEQKLDKRAILERYFNIIELGPRVFGLRAGARYWFGHGSPSNLSVRQAAFLAALTSQPTAMSRRVRKAGGLDPESAERVAVILRAMRRDGVISTEDFEEAKTSSMWFAQSALAPER